MHNNAALEIFAKWGDVPGKKWIMISGPYTHNSKTAAERQKNLDYLNQVALEIFKKGYIPIVGVNAALPIVQAGSQKSPQENSQENLFDLVMMPIALALLTRCDALLRVGGESIGADAEVALMQALGKKVFHSIDQIPENYNQD
jgi:hypothetical protein